MAEGVMYFAVKTIGLSTCNGRKPCTLMNAARHNLREIQAEQGANQRIDPKRMADNDVLVGPVIAAEVVSMANDLLTQVNTQKLKRDHVQAIEAVFSLPPDFPVTSIEYFLKCVEWVRKALPLPILLAVVHKDEAVPHMHMLLLPVKDGKHIGGTLIDRGNLNSLRESFFHKVAGPAGLQRQGAKVRGVVKQWAIIAVLEKYKSMDIPSKLGRSWRLFELDVRRDPTPHMLALGIELETPKPHEPRRPIALKLDEGLSSVALHQSSSVAPEQSVGSICKASATSPDLPDVSSWQC